MKMKAVILCDLKSVVGLPLTSMNTVRFIVNLTQCLFKLVKKPSTDFRKPWNQFFSLNYATTLKSVNLLQIYLNIIESRI